MLPYIFSILGTAFCAAAILVKGKDMRLILLLVFTGNALAGVSYLVAGNGMNGAASYQGLIIHITVLLITVAGMLIHDRHTVKEG